MNKQPLLRYWRVVRRLTIRLLEEFPPDSFDFRPAPEIMTVSQLFKHILQVEIYIRDGFLAGKWEIPEEPSSNIFEKEMLKDKLAIESKRTLQLLSEVPEGRFMKIIKTPYGNLSGEILLQVAVDEEIHHRGNLYTYLRCLGKTPPQMIQHYDEILMEDNDV
ncbi:MAG: DinB family protein [candidate division Zixibacteria bacterium]|nr:DinB family protein [candidate division Zixibacteria bacterium]